MKLKFFSDQRYIPDGMNGDTIFAPFWREVQKDNEYAWKNKIHDHYIEVGRSFFEMTSLEEADLAVLPIGWHEIRGRTLMGRQNKVAKTLALQFAEKVEQAGKPLVVFFIGPRSDEEIPIKDAIIFRGSLYRSKKRNNEFSYPLWTEDLIKHYFNDQLPVRQKQAKPVVGFCGFVQKEKLSTKLKSLTYKVLMGVRYGEIKISPYEGHSLRYKALHYLSANSKVETNFTDRNNYIFLSNQDKELKQKVRLEFVQNIVDSDYTVCCRGSANCSYRLFETLCCGRIPVFIDTDCVLPYDFVIDWKKYCVWVDEKELSQIAEKVAEFHDKISPQEFVDLQHECRKLWKEWLSSEGFFANFYRHFQLGEYEEVRLP